MPTLAIEILVTAAWVGFGLMFVRQRSATEGSALWYAVLGPLGLFLSGYGDLQRGKVDREPTVVAPTEELAVPVQVLVEGRWRDGVLRSWAITDNVWQGRVVYDSGGGQEEAWFSKEQVRHGAERDESSGPGGE